MMGRATCLRVFQLNKCVFSCWNTSDGLHQRCCADISALSEWRHLWSNNTTRHKRSENAAEVMWKGWKPSCVLSRGLFLVNQESIIWGFSLCTVSRVEGPETPPPLKARVTCRHRSAGGGSVLTRSLFPVGPAASATPSSSPSQDEATLCERPVFLRGKVLLSSESYELES